MRIEEFKTWHNEISNWRVDICMWVNLLDKDGFIQFKLSHFYIDWSSVFSVSLNLKELLWNKEIRFYSSVQLCFPFFCLSLPHTSFLKNFNHESTLFRLFPLFLLGTFVKTMKSKAPVSSGCCPVLTLLPCAWGPETPDHPPPHASLAPHFLLTDGLIAPGLTICTKQNKSLSFF